MKSQRKCACPHVFTARCCGCFLYRGTIGFPGSSDGRGSTCNAGDPGLISGLGRSPGEGNDKLLQYSCLESPMDRGSWWAPVHGVKESDATKRLTYTGAPYAHFYTNIFMFLSPAPWNAIDISALQWLSSWIVMSSWNLFHVQITKFLIVFSFVDFWLDLILTFLFKYTETPCGLKVWGISSFSFKNMVSIAHVISISSGTWQQALNNDEGTGYPVTWML